MLKENNLSTNDKILIIGGDSFIGKSLVNSFEEKKLFFNKTSRKSLSDYWYLDLADEHSIAALIDKVNKNKISRVVFLAGITTESKCHNDPTLAEKINVTNTCKLLCELNKLNVFIVYLSSSQVFNHQRSFIPWNENYSPVTLYGQHKVAVEHYMKANIPNAAIVRLTKVIGDKFALFEQILLKAKNKQQIELFGNYCAAPISLVFVKSFLYELLIAKSVGVFQLSGTEDLSYVEMANRLLSRQTLSGKVKSVLAETKGVKPTPYGSLKANSTNKLKVDNQNFSEVMDDYFRVI
jgi:dTDP-4-dehydrorhamnose reductase